MSDEFERLESALRTQAPEAPAEARERAITAAMAAYDQAHETHVDGGRATGGVGKTFGSWWRRLATPKSNTYLVFGGAAASALVVVFLVLVLPVSQVLEPDAVLPGPGMVTEATQEARRESTQINLRMPEDGQTELFEPKGQAPAQEPVTIASPGLSSDESDVNAPAVAMMLEEAVVTALSIEADSSASRVRSYRKDAGQAQSVPEYVEQGRDRFEEFDTNPVKVVVREPVSTFSIDVDTASYSFVRASLNDGLLPQKSAVRVEELINYFPYNYPPPSDRETPFAASVSVLSAPWNADNRLLHIGIRGYEVEDGAFGNSNLVFLIDTSGSMQAPNKLPLLINSLKLLLDSLAPDDRVAIVTYAGSAGVLLEPTRVEHRARIRAALERLNAQGSTAGGEGIRQAYLLAEQHFIEGGINRVVLATDGDFNVGITDLDELTGYIERQRASGVFLSVLGFGTGNYNDALMQRLAQKGNGHALYIDSLSEARKALVEEARSMLFPIAKDVKIQVEFHPAAVSEYRLIGYETRLLEREDFRNDKIDAGEIGSGHRVTAMYEFTPVGSGTERIAPLRYQRQQAAKVDFRDELAFLKIRFKLPEAEESRLITRPVTAADMLDSVDAAPADVRFAAAVAAFGQILRGGVYTGDYDYDDVIALAQGARGDDPFGYRGEFISLVRLAETAAAMPQLR